MKIRVPEYFVSFRCIADRCLDSCCIGWEIDIDERTRAKYKALDTPLGREICEKTSHGCFPLPENGRCAFLDERGLCRIISALGDGYLCDICREHPRYYGVYKDGYEGGLGLSCEEAARMILSLRSLPRFVEIERDIPYSDEDEFAGVTDRLREKIYRNIFIYSIRELVGIYKEYALEADSIVSRAHFYSNNPRIFNIKYETANQNEIKDFLQSFSNLLFECESLENNWHFLINELINIDIDCILDKDNCFRPLLFYFTHRYVRDGVFDMSLGARVLFALGSALTVTALSEIIGGDEPEVRAAVLYSKNIEYSTDNVDYLIDNIDIM